MSIGDRPSGRDRISCLYLNFSAGILHDLNLYRPFVWLPQSLWVINPWCSPSPLVHKLFYTSFSTKISDPQWGGFAGDIGDILFRTGCSKVCQPEHCMIAFVYVICFVIFVWSVFFAYIHGSYFLFCFFFVSETQSVR